MRKKVIKKSMIRRDRNSLNVKSTNIKEHYSNLKIQTVHKIISSEVIK